MQELYLFGGILLLVVASLLILFAPSMKGRGYQTFQEKAEYDLERNTPEDDIVRHARRYHY
ncbi:MAG: hypothetical protein JW779_15830 [Candidatus Thorarchaeota archaeon]|nr:hypothetical protein [Candidatus Thorarchaeota archaeon]